MPRRGKPNAGNRQTRIRRNHRIAVPASVEPTNFFPLPVPGLVAWYDFADYGSLWKDTGRTLAVTADADVIKGVTDKSGAGWHLAEATNGPAYKAGIQNGRSVARFDGTNDTLTAAAFTGINGKSGCTFFLVAKANAGAADKYAFYIAGDVPVLDNNASNKWLAATTGDVGLTSQSTTAANNSWVVITGLFDYTLTTAEAKIYEGGTNVVTQGTNSNNTGTFGTNTLILSAAAAVQFNGDIAEALVFSNALPSTHHNSVGQYLSTKWGLNWTTVS